MKKIIKHMGDQLSIIGEESSFFRGLILFILGLVVSLSLFKLAINIILW